MTAFLEYLAYKGLMIKERVVNDCTTTFPMTSSMLTDRNDTFLRETAVYDYVTPNPIARSRVVKD